MNPGWKRIGIAEERKADAEPQYGPGHEPPDVSRAPHLRFLAHAAIQKQKHVDHQRRRKSDRPPNPVPRPPLQFVAHAIILAANLGRRFRWASRVMRLD